MLSFLSKRFAVGHSSLPTAPDRAGGPVICYVTDRSGFAGSGLAGDLLQHIREAIIGGADWVQIREKDLSARALFDLVSEALEICKQEGGTARISVNDRLDAALAAGAHGVHLRHESMPVQDAVRWRDNGNMPRGFLFGVSCHSLEGAREAEKNGADYVYFGPVFETPSKIPFGKPHGTEKLAEVCRGVQIPVIAIGGITDKNAMDCIAAGAAGIAAIRLFQQARGVEELKGTLDCVRNSPRH